MAIIDQSKIRNFCIIAHIDHGKSTLADRIIEMTGLLTSREMQAQVLDNMDLERERGITIKSQAVRTVYKAKDGQEYIFNLIDTPGHVDFNYEVSRSLAACDGAILVVDAAQGIEAQTLANVYLALDHDLEVIPVLNKIDLPSADPERVAAEIEDVIGLEASDAPRISAKTGLNVEAVLEEIVQKIPAPAGDPEASLQALIFDSLYDSYKGVIVFCRVKNGTIKKGTRMKMMATGAAAEVVEVGYFGAGQFIPCEELSAGMVGYVTASIKNVQDTRVGDTITDLDNPCAEPLPGYKKVTPMVYCGLYPADGAKYPDLRDALEKLQLNDAALYFEPETSVALGFGFRCGFLGLLHLDIIQERLEREFGLDLLATPQSGGFLDFLWIIPALSLISSFGYQMYMSHYQKVHNGQTQPGCMKAMMYFLPLISVYWAWIMPSAVGLYWVISSVTSFLQSLITNKYFSIDHMIARGEAQRAVTLELAEAKARPLPAATQKEIAEKLAAAPQQQKLEKGGGKKQQGGKKKKGGSGGSGNSSAYMGTKK